MKLIQAQQIVDEAILHARSIEAQPIAVYVMDAGGNPVTFTREDGASLFRIDLARAKAMAALGMGADTRILAERAKGNPIFYGSIGQAVGGDFALSPGGVLVRDEEGELLGAVGISGDVGDVDEKCAAFGISATGLRHGADQ